MIVKRAFLILAMVAVSTILNPSNVSAATYYYNYSATGPGTCTDTSWIFPAMLSANAPDEAIGFQKIEEENGVTTLDTTVSGLPGGAHYTVTGTISSFGTYNLPQPYTMTLTIQWFSPNLGVFSTSILRGTCADGVLTVSATNSSEAGNAPVTSGPSIPDGYILKTIICTEAVFDSPAGNPVGDNTVTEGQTFYVNPKSVKGADGRMWSQVFVSSYSNPWILTSCAK